MTTREAFEKLAKALPGKLIQVGLTYDTALSYHPDFARHHICIGEQFHSTSIDGATPETLDALVEKALKAIPKPANKLAELQKKRDEISAEIRNLRASLNLGDAATPGARPGDRSNSHSRREL